MTDEETRPELRDWSHIPLKLTPEDDTIFTEGASSRSPSALGGQYMRRTQGTYALRRQRNPVRGLSPTPPLGTSSTRSTCAACGPELARPTD
jgi:hypothetical protein